MRIIRTLTGIVLLAVFFWSCGGGKKSLNPTPAPSPGTGTGSLLVTADVNGSDIGGGLFVTAFEVIVRDSFNLPVNNASVSMGHSQLGTFAIARDTLTPGRYALSINNYYFGNYTLNVIRGTDNIQNARVFAPEIHSMVDPTTSDTLRMDSSFTVIWSRSTIAGVAEVETRDFASGLTADDGSQVVPASFNPRTDQRIRVWRRNTVSLLGGRPGSSFDGEIRNAVEPIVVQ